MKTVRHQVLPGRTVAKRRVILRHEHCLGELRRSGSDGLYKCTRCGGEVEVGIATSMMLGKQSDDVIPLI